MSNLHRRLLKLERELLPKRRVCRPLPSVFPPLPAPFDVFNRPDPTVGKLLKELEYADKHDADKVPGILARCLRQAVVMLDRDESLVDISKFRYPPPAWAKL